MTIAVVFGVLDWLFVLGDGLAFKLLDVQFIHQVI